jgi:peroxiredoxin family protein
MKTLEKLAIVVREDAFDRILTPLTFAFLEARKGVEVDMLFTLWSVRLLTAPGLESAAMSPGHAAQEQWLLDRLQRDGDPTDLRDFLAALKQTGRVRLHGCKYAAMTFDVMDQDLIPDADGIVDPGWFLREKCLNADHCQYF